MSNLNVRARRQVTALRSDMVACFSRFDRVDAGARGALVRGKQQESRERAKRSHGARATYRQATETLVETHRIDAVEVAVVGQLVQPPGVHL